MKVAVLYALNVAAWHGVWYCIPGMRFDVGVPDDLVIFAETAMLYCMKCWTYGRNISI